MPGLLGIGTGLTGFMDGYAKAQQALGQKQLLQQLLQRNQRQSQAQELEGQALTAGGLPGFSGGIGSGLAGSPSIPQSPMPGQPSTPTPDAPPMPSAQPSPPPSPAPAVTGPPPMQGSADSADTPSTGADPADIVARDAAAEPTTPTPSPTTAASGPSAAAQPDPAPQVPTSPSGQIQVVNPSGNGGTMDLSHFLMQHTDPQAIAARIKQLRPNADPGAVAMATENLYKLANSGDKMQQIQMAAMLKYLGLNATIANRETTHEDRLRQQDLTHGDRVTSQAGVTQRAATAEAGRNTRFDAAEARRNATALDRKLVEAQKQALAEGREARISKNATAAAAAKDKQQKLQTIRTQMYAIVGSKGVAGVTEEQQKQLDALAKQAADLGVKVEGP